MIHLLQKILTSPNIRIAILSFIFSLFLVLLYKNPFSERNLIPNLEPFPDTIHYLNPAINFTEGKGLVIEREGRVMNPSVPFLYSLTLVPGFLIIDDVRFFYITNVILALVGLLFFYKFLAKIIPNPFVIFTVVFLYVTNYFIYWFPNLPMAENLIIPLFQIALYLLVSKLTIKNAIFASIIAISFYATKYASLVLTLSFLFLFLIKVFLDLNIVFKELKISLKLKNKLTIPFIFIGGIAFSFTIFFLMEFLLKGNNILYQVYELMSPMFVKKEVTENVVAAAPVQTWFSLTYFEKNIEIYLNAILGNPMRFLWDFTPLLPKYIAIPAIVGIFAGLLTRGYRFISFSLFLLTLSPIIFISTFYSTDARYIYNAIPALLAGLGLFINFLYKALKEKKLQKLFYILLISFFLFYAYNNFYRIKFQIALNLRYTETPWYYISAKTFNEYFKDFPTSENPPVLITAMPPYYIDFYKTSEFKLLPLSTEQEFSRVREVVWGPYDYKNFIDLYRSLIYEGNELFVTNAGLGNTGYLYRDFNLIKNNFILTEVKKGCLDTCNIYKITPKYP